MRRTKAGPCRARVCYAPRLWYVRKSTDVGHAEQRKCTCRISHFVTNRSVRALRNASMLAACRVHIRSGMPWDVPSPSMPRQGALGTACGEFARRRMSVTCKTIRTVHMSHFVANRWVRALWNAAMLAACRVLIRSGTI